MEQQREATDQQLAMARRKLAAEAESKKAEKEEMFRMQVRRQHKVVARLWEFCREHPDMGNPGRGGGGSCVWFR